MKSFECSCGASVFFDNTACVACGRKLGFAPEPRELVALEPVSGEATADDPLFVAATTPPQKYRQCDNYAREGVCNWLVREDDPNRFCLACRLNATIPDLSIGENRQRWARIEAAKRRLVFTLTGLGLPVVPKLEDPLNGLAFDFKADTPASRVLTGHDGGLITLNVAEADPVLRERARTELNERYRTLLGHFRHESGHYYWDRLIRDSAELGPFRELFGDEQQEYAKALARHYEQGATADWSGNFVSAYASAHPWEDWAETFAHYLHLVDTLETANAFGLRLPGKRPARSEGFESLMARFIDLTLVLNALNRSMGLEDADPYTIGDGARAKLAFVHRVIDRNAALERAA
jgi:hypothetical protein